MPRLRQNKYCSLISAVKNGDLKEVSSFLKNGELPNANDCNGWTSIHHAAFLGNTKILKLLLSGSKKANRINVNLQSWLGETPLMIAASRHKTPVALLHKLYCAGADIDAKSLTNKTALMFACESGRKLSIIHYLIEREANVLDRDDDNFTSLHHAVFSKNLDAVACLAPLAGTILPDDSGNLDVLSMSMTLFPEAVPVLLSSFTRAPEEKHLIHAANLKQWDSFLKFLTAGACHLVRKNGRALLAFHLAWEYPTVLKKTLELMSPSFFSCYMSHGGVDICEWIKSYLYSDESVQVYLQYVASIGFQDLVKGPWTKLPKIVKTYFSPPLHAKENSLISLRHTCRIPARRWLRINAGSDWEAFCSLRDSIVLSPVKQFLLYEED